MLDTLFLSVLNMSITASLVLFGVLLVRLCLKKAPKIFSYALWAIVLFRLICPFSFESAVGLLPINETPIPQDIVYSVEPQINTGLRIVDDAVNSMLPVADNKSSTMNPLQAWAFAGSAFWVIGILAMWSYSIIQFAKLKRKLIGSTPLRDNIYLADHTNSPFVMGFIKPKIYLPSSMAVSEQAFIIAHEQCHIKRLDHIARILAFIALTIHWFNPLVWLAFILSGKDMEMSCDETVMKKMGTDIRAEYSQSLLRFAMGKKLIIAAPLAFGEGDTKDRVKNVMKYKKPVLWVSVIAIIAVICAAVGLMSNPKANLQTEDFNKMIVGAELPYLLYGNNDYCIMNMWHGGVIVYDFTTEKISDRIPFEKLKETGFSYPIPMVSEDGQTIYFREDSQTSKQPYTYSYSVQTKKLEKETDDVKDIIHCESIYENQLAQAILSDGLAYGGTMIVLDDTFIVSRITAGGSRLSDTEIVFLKKDLPSEKTFYLQPNKPASERDISAVNVKYNTEADFLNHPDGVKFQAVAYKASKAYLNGDSEELAACISENCTVDMRLDLFKDIDYMILKWSLEDIKAENKIHATYEFKLKGEDSVSFVSMELIRIDSEWKVDFIGIEK